jgi:Domain of unknown function (DUF222)
MSTVLDPDACAELPGPLTLGDVRECLVKIRAYLSYLDPGSLSGTEANEILEVFAKVERVGVAGKMVVAPVSCEAATWRQEGHRSAAGFLAEKTGTSVGEATGVLETAAALAELPETAMCLLQGEFSEKQIRAVASAASVHREAEGELLEAAARMGLKGLERRCEEIRSLHSYETDELARYNAVRQSRFLRHRRHRDGSFRLEARLTPDAGARLMEAVAAKAQVFFEGARETGLYESAAAYAADGLVSLADDALIGEGTGIGRPHVTLRVDVSSLGRGERQGDETCEIDGVGPVPLATARRLMGDAVLKVVIRDGRDPRSVCALGRSLPAAVAVALEERDPGCQVPGCDHREFLEVHHLVPFGEGGPTRLDNLVRICRWHHDLVTYEGWRIEREVGGWGWHPPPDRGGP